MKRSNARVAGVVSGMTCSMIAAGAWAQQQSAQLVLEEVTVTASKTGEDVRDIAGSVSAMTGERLDQLGAQSAVDYLSRLPGVVFNAAGPGYSTITIRGVNTNTGFAQLSQGTTGVYVNDVPLTDPFFSAGIPDIDTFDVDHVEVHRGPQGTLFGSSSLGGAVNYIARQPDLHAFDLGLVTTQSVTEHSADLNSTYKLRLNAPLIDDELAVRLVALSRREEGYLDNAGTSTRNSNDSSVEGGRLMAAWQPAEGTLLTWSGLYQRTRLDDAFYRDPDVGELAFSSAFPETSDVEVLIHSLRLDESLEFAKLTALASYHEKRGITKSDLTSRFGFAGQVPFTSIEDRVKTHGYTLETRLVSPRGGALEWLVGAMYSNIDERIEEPARAPGAAAAIDALFGPGLGALLTQADVWNLSLEDFTGEELALFGEAAYSFTDRWKLTLGGRAFRTRIDSDFLGAGLINFFATGAATFDHRVRQQEEGINPKIALTYEVSPDVRVHALASKGFRFGGTNVNPGATKLTFDSDSLWNYEIGLKSEWADRAVVFDASAYSIDWSDIQLVLTDPITAGSYTSNAGDARINGVEMSLGWYSSSGLELSSSVTWLDAQLSKDFDPGFGAVVPKGARLPGASEWQVASTVGYRSAAGMQPFFLLSHRYVSEAPGVLQHPQVRTGGYNLVDLRAGLSIRTVELAVFVSNLTDELAATAGTFYSQPSALETHHYITRPRTIGVTFGWSL